MSKQEHDKFVIYHLNRFPVHYYMFVKYSEFLNDRFIVKEWTEDILEAKLFKEKVANVMVTKAFNLRTYSFTKFLVQNIFEK